MELLLPGSSWHHLQLRPGAEIASSAQTLSRSGDCEGLASACAFKSAFDQGVFASDGRASRGYLVVRCGLHAT
jgi:hypothetical protein